jgi:hypothetical protein
MASRALTAMLISAVSNWPASALMKHGWSGTRVTIWIGDPVNVPIISISVCTLLPTSNTSGFRVCRRAKASNWAVNFAARLTVSEIAST